MKSKMMKISPSVRIAKLEKWRTFKWEENPRNVEERLVSPGQRPKRVVERNRRSNPGASWMKKPEGTEASVEEARLALETFWGQNYYAQIDFIMCHVRDAEDDPDLRFELIKLKGKPIIIVWDTEEECLFVDPAPIPSPLYRPTFFAAYPRSLKYDVQFSLFENGLEVDNNYIYHLPELIEMKGNKFRVFRHNVNKFDEMMGNQIRILNSPEGLYHHLTPKNIDDFREDCERLVDENIKAELDWDDYLLSMYMIDGLLDRLRPSDSDDEFKSIFEGTNRNIQYQIGIHEDKVVSIDVGLKLGPGVLGHYIGKYDKSYKFLVDCSRYTFYKTAYMNGYNYVNDGSDLDHPGLRQFKRKFNPMRVIKLYSFSPGEAGEGGD